MNKPLANITLFVRPGRTGTGLETSDSLFQKRVVLGSLSLVFFLRDLRGSGAKGEADRGERSPLLDRLPLVTKARSRRNVLVGTL